RFLALLHRVMAHYGLADLPPGQPLERGLLRVYAAHGRAAEGRRLAEAVLRSITRVSVAGLDLAGDAELAGALSTCIALRGTVPPRVADAATEARYALFELPEIRRRTADATAALDHAVAALERPHRPALETLHQLADSPAAVFEHIAAWATADDRMRRVAALH